MKDRQLDGLIVAAQANATDTLSEGRFRQARDELLEQIMAIPDVASDLTPTTTDSDRSSATTVQLDPGRHRPQQPRRRRRAVVGIAAAAAVLAALAIPTYLTRGGSPQNVVVQPAAAEPVGAGDHLILDLPGWRLTSMSQTSTVDQDMFFTRGSSQVNVTRYPADQYRNFLTDRSADGRHSTITVLGAEGRLYTYREDEDYEVLLPPQGRSFLGIRAMAGDLGQLTTVLGGLEYVDDATWEAWVPADFVTADREPVVIRQMLQGIELPPGLRAKDLREGFDQSYYHFGAHVTGTVACGWISSFLKAGTEHDAAASERARKALTDSQDWAVLKRMESQGGWTAVLREYADAVSKGTPVKGGSDRVTLANSYKSALGCD